MVQVRNLVLFFLLLMFTNGKSQAYQPFTVTALDTSSKGYYFLVPQKVGANPNSINPTHMILDRSGNVVYYNEFTTGNTGDFKVQPNGLMSYSRNGQFYLMDSSFTIVDSLSAKNGVTTDLHDIQVLPNGHFLLLGTEQVIMNLTAFNYFGPNGNAPGSATANVKCGVIQEQDASKNVVFEWHCKDYFSFGDVDPYYLAGPNNVDWTHCNAVELDQDGNILLSSRHLNEITKINRGDSSVIWRLGGNANQFTFVNDPERFRAQHDIRRQPTGNITFFDNGNGNGALPFHPAAAKEYFLDENLLTATLTWSYIDNPNCISGAMGNVQRLASGNTLVGYGISSNDNKVFNVVNMAGQKVFEIEFADTLWSYRCFNYPVLPWSFERPVINCVNISGQYFLDAGSGHSSYLWSNGAATQTIAVSGLDTFSVFVPCGNGGFISSERFVVVDSVNPCNLSGISQESFAHNFSIFPNPAFDKLSLQFFSLGKDMQKVEVTDVSGKKIISFSEPQNALSEIFIGLLEPGVYFVRIGSATRKFIKE